MNIVTLAVIGAKVIMAIITARNMSMTTKNMTMKRID